LSNWIEKNLQEAEITVSKIIKAISGKPHGQGITVKKPQGNDNVRLMVLTLIPATGR